MIKLFIIFSLGRRTLQYVKSKTIKWNAIFVYSFLEITLSGFHCILRAPVIDKRLPTCSIYDGIKKFTGENPTELSLFCGKSGFKQ